MAKSYLDSNGLLYFWGKIKSYVATAISGKQDTISDLSTIRSGAAKGATAVQEETDPVFSASAAAGITAGDITNWNSKTDTKGTVTKVKMNGTEKSPNSSGVVDIGTVITAHQDISGKADKSEMSVSESGDSVTITLKTGTSATVLKEHQDISGKADKSATVSAVTYDTTNKKLRKTINGSTTDIVTAAKIVTDGGGITDVSGKVDKTTTVNGHALSGNVTVTASDIGVESGAEVNQNAFSNIKVGSNTVAADSKTDTVEFAAGSNVTITPDTTNGKITIAATDTKYTAASATPKMDGTGAVGTSAKYAREDHVHPSDTTRVPTSRTVNGKALSANIALSASDVSAIPTSAKGAANGVASLDANGKVPSSQLPSYVDDVIEAYARSGQTALSSTWLATGSATGTVITPEAGKIYVLMADSGDYAANTQFRWSGTAYVKLNDGGVSAITNAEIDTIVAS